MTADQIIHIGLTLLVQIAGHFFTKDKIKDVDHKINLVKTQVAADMNLAQTKIDSGLSQVSSAVQAVQATSDTSASTPSA